MRAIATMAACAVLATGCASDAGELHSCEGLADRWVVLQQEILDSVDDPEPDPDADNRHAAAMIEQARDASAVGCAEQVATGSTLICARLDRLQPRGPRGEALAAGLRAQCR